MRLVASALSEWVEPPSANNLATARGISAAAAADATRLWACHMERPADSLLSRLTWAAVGYQYQWTPRTYDRRCYSPFPHGLAQLATELACACGWSLRPEAAIINLYNASSTMGGHKDDAEPCQEVPIVSISLGLEAIYLLGGLTKAEAPCAMRLRSGDVIVQGGRSRGYVHGVPRVLPATLPPHLHPSDAAYLLGATHRNATAPDELRPFAQWLTEHRLNINVRQVFSETDSPPPWDVVQSVEEGGMRASSTMMADAEVDDATQEREVRKRLRTDEQLLHCSSEMIT